MTDELQLHQIIERDAMWNGNPTPNTQLLDDRRILLRLLSESREAMEGLKSELQGARVFLEESEKLRIAERKERLAAANALGEKMVERDQLRASNAAKDAQIAEMREGLQLAVERIQSSVHGDNCYLSDHYEGDPGNQCNCGKESLIAHLDSLLSRTTEGRK